MSVYVMSRVWREGPEDRTDLLVLLALADFADDDGKCWPSMASIASKSRLSSPRAAQKVVRRLEVNDWLKVSTGGGRSGCNQYLINTARLDGVNPEETPSPGSPRPEDAPVRKRAKPRPKTQETPSPGSPEPSIPIKEPSISKVQQILEQVLPRQVAEDFISHRKSKRAKMTERAASLIVADLSKSPDPTADVEKSIKNGWTGVFITEQEKRGQNEKPASKSEKHMDAFIAGARGAG